MRCLVGLVLVSVSAFAQGGAGSSFRWIQRVGAGQETLAGLGTDAAGNVYIVGNTQAAGFPVQSPVQTTVPGLKNRDVFVVKLDAAGNVVYSTTFGGTGDDQAQAATVDAAGNVYVTGTTLSTDFPTTGGAYRTAPPPAGPFGLRGATFVFHLDAGGRVAYSTYFSTPESVPRAIAVDGAGSAYVTGSTQGGLPVTPGAYRTECNCGLFSNGFFATPQLDGFVARFDAAGSKLVYATYAGVGAGIGMTIGSALAVGTDGTAYIGGTSGIYRLSADGSKLLGQGSPKVLVQAMAMAPDGSLYVAGGAVRNPGGFAPTPSAAQPADNLLPLLPSQAVVGQQMAIARMDGALTRTLAATYFGGGYGNTILSLAVDGAGNVLAGGGTAPRGLPTLAPLAEGFGSPGTGFAAVLGDDLTAIRFSSYFGDTENFRVQGVAAGRDGNLVLAGATSNGSVWVNSVDVTRPPAARVDSVANAASRVDDPISAGEIVVVRGDGFDADTAVRIGGRTAQVLGATAREITAIAPAELPDGAATVEVEARGTRSNTVLAPVAAASPGLYSVDRTGTGQGYIVNEDGGMNGPDHPARPGEKITIFATGVGRLSFDQGYAVTENPVSMFVDGWYCRGSAAVLGPVDGFTGDVYQLTVFVPTYDEIVSVNPDLKTFRYSPQVGVVLRIAGRPSQNGLAISILP